MKILILVVMFLLVSCNQEAKRTTPRTKDLTKEAAAQIIQTQNPLSGTVIETMDASKYTYVLVDNGHEKVWIAGPKTEVKVGQQIAGSRGMPMQNFESKTLGKTFDTIYFVERWLQTASAQSSVQQAPSNPLSGKIVETMNASKYTYVLIDNGTHQIWVAGPKKDVKVGEQITAGRGMLMESFASKSLNRTFEKIYFVSQWLSEENGKAMAKVEPSKGQANDHTKVTSKIFVKKIDHQGDEVSIGSLYSDKSKYQGKTVKVKGTVVKFLTEIMGKNWIHIQDGSSKDHPDLTITTDEKVTVGDIISLKGVISVNKDFGFGYFYPVIMEQGKVLQ